MPNQSRTNKGMVLEEVLRAFFLRAGFFAVRGVPVTFAEEEFTDIDLWLYERPTGTARRVQICDIKYKQRPKAIERILCTSGLARALEIDGAYVATTDRRKSLRQLAGRLGIQLIDGADIQRIQSQRGLLCRARITDEQLIGELRTVDRDSKDKALQAERNELLAALADGFGALSVVRSLEVFRRLCTAVVSYHPDSIGARAAGRLCYLAAAIAAESIDYVSVGAAFRSIEEKRDVILETIRLGALSSNDGQKSLHLALALVRRYAPGGAGTAVALETSLRSDLEKRPAEIVADQTTALLRDDALFQVGLHLESASYGARLPTFDQLDVTAKSMLGALLDYAGIKREKFATSWKTTGMTEPDSPTTSAEGPQQEIPFRDSSD